LEGGGRFSFKPREKMKNTHPNSGGPLPDCLFGSMTLFGVRHGSAMERLVAMHANHSGGQGTTGYTAVGEGRFSHLFPKANNGL